MQENSIPASTNTNIIDQAQFEADKRAVYKWVIQFVFIYLVVPSNLSVTLCCIYCCFILFFFVQNYCEMAFQLLSEQREKHNEYIKTYTYLFDFDIFLVTHCSSIGCPFVDRVSWLNNRFIHSFVITIICN